MFPSFIVVLVKPQVEGLECFSTEIEFIVFYKINLRINRGCY